MKQDRNRGAISSTKFFEKPGSYDGKWKPQSVSDGLRGVASSPGDINNLHAIEEMNVCFTGVPSNGTSESAGVLSGKTSGSKDDNGKQKEDVGVLSDNSYRLEDSTPINFVSTVSGRLHDSSRVNDVVSKERVVHSVSFDKVMVSPIRDPEPNKNEGKWKIWAKKGGRLAVRKGGRCSHFKNVGVEKKDFLGLVQDSWVTADGGNPLIKFHAKATARKKRNLILVLFDKRGTWSTSEDEIEGIINSYFSSLFASSRPSRVLLDAVLNSVEARLPSNLKDFLDASFTGRLKYQIVSC
ncbi:hypothetical protein QYF36_017822 [Acer negundo]|nr:hypothetical protein QYF36_017822 [Acer negundo]